MKSLKILVPTLAACLALTTACASSAQREGGGGEGANYPSGPVTMTVGADPGSGFDLTMRTLVDVLRSERVVTSPMPIENRPGGAGAVWTAQMVERYAGEDDQVSVTSLVMMTNHAREQSEYNYDDVTMIARVLLENYLVVASPDSEYQDLGAVLDAIVEDPASVPVGAASDDQLPFALLVEAAGGDPSQVNFVAYDGGGQQSTALLSGDIDVAIAGSSEFLPLIAGGKIEALSVIGEERLGALEDVPTAVEEGYDVTLSNWRGIFGPPDMPDYAVEYWQQAIQEALETDAWDEAAEKNQWVTSYLAGEELTTYLDETDAAVTEAFEQTEAS